MCMCVCECVSVCVSVPVCVCVCVSPPVHTEGVSVRMVESQHEAGAAGGQHHSAVAEPGSPRLPCRPQPAAVPRTRSLWRSVSVCLCCLGWFLLFFITRLLLYLLYRPSC